MAGTLYELGLIRRKDGVPMPASGDPDVQAERVCRDVATYLSQLRAGAANAAAAAAAAAAGGTAPATTVPQPTPDGLAAFLQSNWPGAAAAVASEYFWVLDPITGIRIKFCINNEVVLTTEKPPVGNDKPVDPSLVISFRMLMT